MALAGKRLGSNQLLKRTGVEHDARVEHDAQSVLKVRGQLSRLAKRHGVIVGRGNGSELPAFICNLGKKNKKPTDSERMRKA